MAEVDCSNAIQQMYRLKPDVSTEFCCLHHVRTFWQEIMGGAKRMMEEHEAKRGIALQIALEAGVLKQCELHDDCIYEGGKEVENAYKLANHKVSNGELEDVFENQREMTDIIKDVVEDHAAEECYACAKNCNE